MPRIASGFHEDRVPALGLPGLIDTPVAGAVSWLSRAVRPCFLAVAIVAGIGRHRPPGLGRVSGGLHLRGDPARIPFVGLPGLAFAILLAAILGTGAARPGRIGAHRPDRPGGLLALYVFPFELSGPALVAAWAALGAVAFVVEALIIEPRVGPAFDPATLTRHLRPAVRAVGALAGAAVLVHLVTRDFPIDHLGKVVLSSIPY